MTRFWHPVSDMHAVQASGELILERGEGRHVWDDAGNRYIDSTGGLWYANVGYGRAEIADAAAAQMRRLHAYSHYGDVSSRPTTELAERISVDRADGGCRGLLHERRRRVDRDRRQARAPLLEPARPARPHRDHLAGARVPRSRGLRHEHRRNRGVQGRASARSPEARRGSPGTPPRRSRRRSRRSGRSGSPPSSASRSSAPVASTCRRTAICRRCREICRRARACCSSPTR